MTFQEQISKVVKTANEAKILVDSIKANLDAWKMGRIDAELALFNVREALMQFELEIDKNG